MAKFGKKGHIGVDKHKFVRYSITKQEAMTAAANFERRERP